MWTAILKSLNDFSDHRVSSHLADLHGHYVIVPVDKAPNNVVFVCKITI